MPIFAPKKKEVPEIPEMVPKVPTAEELKGIAGKLRELIGTKGEAPKKPEEIPKAPPAVEELKKIIEKVEEVPKPEEVKKEVPERVAGPPLFIKLERYHRILRYISELRRVLFTTKAITSTLAEIEKLREDNVKLLRKTIERIDTRLADLDKELLRPRELPAGYPEEVTEVGGMETVVSDLRSQLQSLKDELESVA